MPQFRGGLPPEFWDAVFKPRGPAGLLGGQTLLGMIPGVGQGMAAVDTQQAAREGSPLGVGFGILGMLPGGKPLSGAMGGIIDLAKERAKRGPRKTDPIRELNLPPKGSQDVYPNEGFQGYRAAVENWKAEQKLTKFNEEFGAPLGGMSAAPGKKSLEENIKHSMDLIDSVDKKFKSFLQPGRLKHGNAKELQSAYKVLQDQFDKGGIPVDVLEEVEAVVTALDDAGAISHTDHVIEIINSILERSYNPS